MYILLQSSQHVFTVQPSVKYGGQAMQRLRIMFMTAVPESECDFSKKLRFNSSTIKLSDDIK